MEIKASSKYDWKTLNKFCYFTVFTRYKINTIYYTLLILHMLLTLLPVLPDIIDCSRAYGFSFDMIDDAVIFYGTFAICWLLFILFLPKIKYGNRKSKQNAENEYVFMDEKIQFVQDATDVNKSASIKYNAVYRVYETKEFFYMFLYINKRETYIIDKSTVTGGTVEDLRMLLISKIGEKKYKMKFKV